MYLNDLSTVFVNSKYHFFADDTVLYISGENLYTTLSDMNKELANISKLLAVNKLKLNVNKTKCMLIEKKKINEFWKVNKFGIIIDKAEIELVDKIKYLGVIMDHELKFKDHCDYICKKISKKIGVMGRLNKVLTTYAMKVVYNTIVLPHYNYCATLLYLFNDTDIHRLQVLQNKGMRIVLKCNKYTRVADMLRLLQWLNVKQFAEFCTLLFIHKIKLKMMPSYYGNMLQQCDSIHKYNTRDKENYYVQTRCKDIAYNSIFVKGVIKYNMLENKVKNVTSIEVFKKYLKAAFINR